MFTEAAKTAARAVRSALPDAEVQAFDYELSLGIAFLDTRQAWRGDVYEGFNIRDPQHVADLINYVRAERQKA